MIHITVVLLRQSWELGRMPSGDSTWSKQIKRKQPRDEPVRPQQHLTPSRNSKCFRSSSSGRCCCLDCLCLNLLLAVSEDPLPPAELCAAHVPVPRLFARHTATQICLSMRTMDNSVEQTIALHPMVSGEAVTPEHVQTTLLSTGLVSSVRLSAEDLPFHHVVLVIR